MDDEAWQPQSDNDQHSKMFVGGLAQTVTSDFLKAYFSNYGPVQDAFVLMDEQSGRSRGFGFVTFEDPLTLKNVLRQKPHILGNKQVDCKHAVNKNIKRAIKTSSVPNFCSAWATAYDSRSSGGGAAPDETETVSKEEPSPNAAGQPPLGPSSLGVSSGQPLLGHEWADNDSTDLFLTGGGKSYLALSGDKWLEDCEEADARKIFVGGLPDITPLEFAKYFEHFGEVADAMIMYDRKRRRQRGFGFITFVSDEGVRNALDFSRHPVKGKVVEVKKAHPLVLQSERVPAKKERDAELLRRETVAEHYTFASSAMDETTAAGTASCATTFPTGGPLGHPPLGCGNVGVAGGHPPSPQMYESRYPEAPWNTSWLVQR